MTIGSSLILIAVGGILAFAVNYEIVGLNIKTVGAILIIVGGIGLAFAVAMMNGYGPWGTRTVAVQPVAPVVPVAPTNAGPPASL